jgi:hypothetical protein
LIALFSINARKTKVSIGVKIRKAKTAQKTKVSTGLKFRKEKAG